MNVIEIDRALRKLRLSAMAEVLEVRLLEAQTDSTAHLDFLSTSFSDVRIAFWRDDSNKPPFATPANASTTTTSTSTRR